MSWFVAQLRCPACESTQVLDKAGLANWLKERGRLRRETKPEVPMMLELGQIDAMNARCADCGENGLCLEVPPEEQADWGDARRCDACRETIDPLRLEVFPDTQLCTACQQKSESGVTIDTDAEYCPRCGGLMEVKSRQQGVTRYQLVCTECRYRSS